MTFFERLDAIDRLIAADPTEEAIASLKVLVTEQASETYLFQRLKGQTWLRGLYSAGWFQTPPELVKQKGGLSYPVWSALELVKDVAKEAAETNSKPTLLLLKQLISSIARTDNPYIFRSLVEIALILPPSEAADLAFTLQGWLGQQSKVIGNELMTLIGILAKEGKRDASLRLFRSAFAIFPDRSYYEASPEHRFLPNPKSRFDTWHYKDQLKRALPALNEHTRDVTLIVVLCELLNDYIRFSQSDTMTGGPEDISYVWRPAIEEHSQNRDTGYSDALVEALRDSCEMLIKKVPTRFYDVVEVLGAYQWFIFTRIILHLLRTAESAPLDMVASYLTNWIYFDEIPVRHEYSLLLRHSFSKLEETDQATILAYIDEGPDRQGVIRSLERWTGHKPDDQQISQRIQYWQFEWLSFIANDLNTEWQAKYASLTNRFSQVRHPEFPSYMESQGGFVGVESPMTLEQVQAMAIDDLLAFARDWTPPPDSDALTSPSIEGLASQIRHRATVKPEEFSHYAVKLIGLRDSYVHAFLEGLAQALKTDHTLSWDGVLQLCNWVAQQPSKDWGWVKRAITHILEEAFPKKKSGLVHEYHRTQVWAVLETLTNAPDDEKESPEETTTTDPFMQSLNTVVGSTLHVAIRYGLWVRDNSSGYAGIKSIPELEALVWRILSSSLGDLLAVRAVFGKWFPWLILLDRDWATKLRDHVFPAQPEVFWEAAWDAYIKYCGAFDDVLPVLRLEYHRAIADMPRPWVLSSRKEGSAEHLAEHIVSYYWRGKVSLAEDDLLMRFFRAADAKTQYHALQVLGRALAGGSPQDEILKRLVELYETLLSQKAAQSLAPELAAFGYWIVSDHFEESWAIATLARTIQQSKAIEPTDDVLEKMQQLARNYPHEVAVALDSLIAGDHDHWELDYWSGKIHAICTELDQVKEPNVRAALSRVANRLGQLGKYEFRRFA